MGPGWREGLLMPARAPRGLYIGVTFRTLFLADVTFADAGGGTAFPVITRGKGRHAAAQTDKRGKCKLLVELHGRLRGGLRSPRDSM